MKSILIKKPGSFEIIDIERPKPQPDEILIQVTATSLCNQHDWKVNKGFYKDLKYLEYVEIGDEVRNFQVGDHAVMSGLGGPPLYSEFVTRKSTFVAKVDKAIPFEHIAMSELFGCVHRACKKVPDYQGKSVAVSGCGPGGLSALQVVKAYRAERVIEQREL